MKILLLQNWNISKNSFSIRELLASREKILFLFVQHKIYVIKQYINKTFWIYIYLKYIHINNLTKYSAININLV